MIMENDKINQIEKQSVTITLSSLILASIHGIIGYIAVYFFKPLWTKIMKWSGYESNSQND